MLWEKPKQWKGTAKPKERAILIDIQWTSNKESHQNNINEREQKSILKRILPKSSLGFSLYILWKSEMNFFCTTQHTWYIQLLDADGPMKGFCIFTELKNTCLCSDENKIYILRQDEKMKHKILSIQASFSTFDGQVYPNYTLTRPPQRWECLFNHKDHFVLCCVFWRWQWLLRRQHSFPIRWGHGDWTMYPWWAVSKMPVCHFDGWFFVWNVYDHAFGF